MATLIKIKKAAPTITINTKKHSLIEAYGAAKEKRLDIEIKSRKDVWKR